MKVRKAICLVTQVLSVFALLQSPFSRTRGASHRGKTTSINMSTAQDVEVQGQNVLGGPLQCCCQDPLTGYYRDGFCRTGGSDYGVHVVCSQVTEDFLEYTKSKGNDLSTPHPPGFPGLKDGDRWCLCASRWKEALDAGRAPPIVLKATHMRALDFVDLDELKKFAVDADEPAS